MLLLHKIIIIGLILCIAATGILYYDLNDRFSILEKEYDDLNEKYGHSLEMNKICWEDITLCQSIYEMLKDNKSKNKMG